MFITSINYSNKPTPTFNGYNRKGSDLSYKTLQKLVKQDLTVAEMVTKLGCSEAGLRKALQRHNLIAKSALKTISQTDVDTIKDLLNKGYSNIKIAEITGLHRITIGKIAQKNGFTSKKYKKAQISLAKLEEAVKQNMSLADLAKTFSCSISTIRNYLKNFDLKTKEAEKLDNISKETLIELLDQGYNQYEIAKKLGVGAPALTGLLKKYQLKTIPIRIVDTIKKADILEMITPTTTINQLCQMLNVSRNIVCRLIENFELPIKINKKTKPENIPTPEEAYQLLKDGYSIQQIADKFSCSYCAIKTRVASFPKVRKQKNKDSFKVKQTLENIQNSLDFDLLKSFIRDKKSVDEIAVDCNLSANNVENTLFNINQRVFHHEKYNCADPWEEKAKFNILIKKGDSPVQIAELYGVSIETAKAWLLECEIKAPKEKQSPKKEDIIQALESVKQTTRRGGEIIDFGKNLNISNATFEYLVEKYSLDELFLRAKYNI